MKEDTSEKRSEHTEEVRTLNICSQIDCKILTRKNSPFDRWRSQDTKNRVVNYEERHRANFRVLFKHK